jgi:hypothetical protein
VSIVGNVTAYSGNSHGCSLPHPVNKLCEEPALRMLEVAEINFDEEVYIP